MATNAPSTVRAKRVRERRSRGVAMIAPVEVGEGGVALLVSNGLLKEHETGDRKAVEAACLAALEQWSMGRAVGAPGGSPDAMRFSASDALSRASASDHSGYRPMVWRTIRPLTRRMTNHTRAPDVATRRPKPRRAAS